MASMINSTSRMRNESCQWNELGRHDTSLNTLAKHNKKSTSCHRWWGNTSDAIATRVSRINCHESSKFWHFCHGGFIRSRLAQSTHAGTHLGYALVTMTSRRKKSQKNKYNQYNLTSNSSTSVQYQYKEEKKHNWYRKYIAPERTQSEASRM